MIQPPDGTDSGSPVVSLSERRKAAAKIRTSAGRTDAVRILELEADVSRLVDLVADLEHRFQEQEGFLRKVLRLMRRERKQGKEARQVPPGTDQGPPASSPSPSSLDK